MSDSRHNSPAQILFGSGGGATPADREIRHPPLNGPREERSNEDSTPIAPA